MGKRIDRTGERFGRLVVVRLVGVAKNWAGVWECMCDCGNTVNVRYNNLSSGSTKSCGCLKRENIIKRSTKHGLSGGHGNYTRLYRTWLGMRRRCLSKKSQDYRHYGGRGVGICQEWDNYAAFHSWAHKNGYSEDLTIERIDNDGNYSPSNCRWATRKEQSRNTRQNRLIAFGGTVKTVAEWAEHLGMPHVTLRMRLHRGWSVKRALTAPIKKTEEVV